MEVKDYVSWDRNKVVAYDVMTGSYDQVCRIARFAEKADANKFRDQYNDDLRRGLTVLRLRGTLDMSIEEERDRLRENAAYVSDVHDIPVIPAGGTLSPDKYNADYGWYYNQATDTSKE